MVVPDLTNPVLAPIVRGIEDVLWEAGYGCLLVDTDNRPDREAALVDELIARRCEGIVLATATRDSATAAELARAGTPAVLVTRSTDRETLPLVAGDDASGVTAAVHHLVGLGHRRIVHLTGPTNLATTRRRQGAFEATMAELVPDQEVRVLNGPSFTVATGRDLGRQALTGDSPFTAVLAGNDMIALGVYEALAEADLRCPGDVSVVGHNDMPFMDHVAPPLTTVALPQREVGAEAARVLLALLRDEPAEAVRLLPTELVVRASTAPVSARV